MDSPLIEAEGLGFSYRKAVLSDFDLTLGAGEIAMLLGLNGAGKTTALRLLAGELKPDGGRVRIAGGDPRRARFRSRLFHLPELSELPAHLNSRELVRFTMDLFGRSGPGARRRCDEALDRVGLAGHRRKRIPSLSKGMQRRLEVAALVAVDPEVWLLDEPQAGLDPQGLRLLREICKEARSRQRALVVSSHALGDVSALADRVVVLEAGRTRFSGDRAALLRAVGASGYVVYGGNETLQSDLRELVTRCGGRLEGPEVPPDGLEALLFGEEPSR